SADSVKAKLKNQAKKQGRLFQDELVAYCLERTIYRISMSKYNENFTLKGGIFLYAIFNGEFSRTTRDIDLLARALNNERNWRS
ncbi:nucleotidyl transferase AbiEii/AbiGii toxin family protein, partial [Petrocella sp. FN5]|uniref:nucleotidyl transferase AbiEii/AbiGii toxin family protein n=1 Tax=Petrocella sp. FN5 TaxID=3032002 RepID=UPI0023DCBE9C